MVLYTDRQQDMQLPISRKSTKETPHFLLALFLL